MSRAQALAHNQADDRNLQEVAGLKLFFRLAEEWDLSTDEQIALLGNMGRSRFFQLKKNPEKGGLSDDELDRLSFLANIHMALAVLFTEENEKRFLKNVQDEEGDFPGTSPLAYMTSGIRGLVEMSNYVNGLRGGAFS